MKQYIVQLSIYADTEEEIVKACEIESRSLAGLALEGMEGRIEVMNLDKVEDSE